MQRRTGIIALAVGAAVVRASAAHAISHTNDYKTNMENFRTCTDPELSSCTYADVLAPSIFYLPNASKVTVVYGGGTSASIRIDASGILTDSDVSYACTAESFACTPGSPTGHCAAGPRQGQACSVDSCLGGSNEGALCTVNSQCPGGACTAGSTCRANTCQGGLRDNLSCNGGGDPACTSTVSSSGWKVVFRGNESRAIYIPGTPLWTDFHLLGGNSGDGCELTCPFSLDANSAINSASLSCTLSGDCQASVEAFHHVELQDPNGDVVAIPTLGNAKIVTTYVDGDPAKDGDCINDPNRPRCQ